MHLRYSYDKYDDLAGYAYSNNHPPSDYYIEDSCFQIWTNEIGCFDTSISNLADYILLVGDSFAWGWVKYEDTYGKVIEDTTGVRVIKCGVLGYGTRQELIKAKRVYEEISTFIKQGETPGLIVVGYCWNDWLDDWLFPKAVNVDGNPVIGIEIANWITGAKKTLTKNELQRKIQEQRYIQNNIKERIKTWLRNNSYVYCQLMDVGFFRNILSRFGVVKANDISFPYDQYAYLTPFYGGYDQFPWVMDAWNMHVANLRDFKRYAASINNKLLVVLIPDKSSVYDYLEKKVRAEMSSVFVTNNNYPHKVIIDSLKREGIIYMDLLPALRQYADQTPRKNLDTKKDLYYQTDAHLSPKGQKLTGLLISKHIVENGMIDVQNKDIILKQIEESIVNYKDKLRGR